LSGLSVVALLYRRITSIGTELLETRVKLTIFKQSPESRIVFVGCVTCFDDADADADNKNILTIS